MALHQKNSEGSPGWLSWLVTRPTLGFGSGQDLTVPVFKPCIGLCTGSMEPAWDSLSPPLLPPPPSSSLSLSAPPSLVLSLSK